MIRVIVDTGILEAGALVGQVCCISDDTFSVPLGNTYNDPALMFQLIIELKPD